MIADRRDSLVSQELHRRVAENTGQVAIEALWALNAVGKLDEAAALKALQHSEPTVRLWTVRLLGDAARVSPAVAAALANQASNEPDVEVRSQLACSAKRLPARDALPIVRTLLRHNEDERDIHLPLLLWWAIESKVATDPDQVLALLSEPTTWNLPIVKRTITERLMRRFGSSGTRQNLTFCRGCWRWHQALTTSSV